VELEATAPTQPGVLIRAVIPGSPAEDAGIIPKDLLLRVAGQPVHQPRDVVELVGEHVRGERISIALRRGDSDRMLGVVLDRRPDDTQVHRMRYVGSPAPQLERLQAVQGAVSLQLGALRGKVVVVEFWSPWCLVCRLLVPTVNAWYQRYSPQGVEVLGITTEPVVQAAQTARQLGIIHPIASDPTGRTTRAYRALALPTVFIIDRNGTVRDVMVGYSTQRLQEMEAVIERLITESPPASGHRSLPQPNGAKGHRCWYAAS
jgi:peroxiredoxin